MTDEPKSIWIDRGPNGGWMFRTEKLHDSVRQYVPADRIEAQAAEIERLRKAGTKMSGYAGHDDDCEIMLKGVWGDKTPCDCGYEDAWKALRDALGEAE